MIVIIEFERMKDNDNKQKTVHIECDRINYFEKAKDPQHIEWGFDLLRNDGVVYSGKWSADMEVRAYVMENGKTVNRLPRS